MQVSSPLPEAQRLIFGKRSAALLQTTSYFLTNFCSDIGGTWECFVCDLLQISAPLSYLKKGYFGFLRYLFRGRLFPREQNLLPKSPFLLKWVTKHIRNPHTSPELSQGGCKQYFSHLRFVTQSVRKWFENHQLFLLSVFI